MAAERLQKLLSRRGLASRREAERWIAAGRVAVNGSVVTELGVKVDPAVDRIAVDGAALPAEVAPVVVLLNKPIGYVTTVRDPHAERTVMELVAGVGRRVYPVGRLDQDTRGVLLLSDDGDLTHALLHPARAVEKVYRVTVGGVLSDAALEQLASGVEVEGRTTAPARLWDVGRRGGSTSFQLALREGRKRQVRLMVRAVGGRVTDLERVSFAGLTCRGLPEGSWRLLEAAEVAALRRAAGLPGEGPGTPPRGAGRGTGPAGRPRKEPR